MGPKKEVVSGVFTKEGKGVLLVKKRDVWIFPGGKRKPKETPIECLYREVEKEELPNLRIRHPALIERNFTGITPHSKEPMQAQVFTGNIEGSIEPDKEICKADWFTIPIDAVLSEVTSQIIAHFYCNGFLKRRVKNN